MIIDNLGFKTDKVQLDVTDGVATVWFTDPANYNPLPAEAMDDINACMCYCDAEDAVRVIVFRGQGGVFTAGGDVKGMKKRLDAGINNTVANLHHGGDCLTRILAMRKPTIAWIDGACAGVGMSIAMACDFAIAKETATMVFAFINIGFIPDGGIIPMLCKAIGTKKAVNLLMSGKRFKAKEAAEWGIITEAVPEEQLEETVQKYINKYKNGPSVAYAQMKQLIYNAMYADVPMTVQSEAYCQHICAATEDHYEAVSAFIEKRKPNFQGK